MGIDGRHSLRSLIGWNEENRVELKCIQVNVELAFRNVQKTSSFLFRSYSYLSHTLSHFHPLSLSLSLSLSPSLPLPLSFSYFSPFLISLISFTLNLTLTHTLFHSYSIFLSPLHTYLSHISLCLSHAHTFFSLS